MERRLCTPQNECFRRLLALIREDADIDDLSNHITNVFNAVAHQVMPSKRARVSRAIGSKKRNKWFNKECREARRLYARTKRQHKHTNTLESETALKSASKTYKKL